MKVSPYLSSSVRKARKAHFNADKAERRDLLRTRLSKELRGKYEIKAAVIRRGDKVKIVKGSNKGKFGTVAKVCYANMRVYITELTRENSKKHLRMIPFSSAQLELTELFMNKDRAESIPNA